MLKLILFYLLGAFPTGVLVAKAYGVSITKEGSGNVGATNVARVVGKTAGIITLLGDMLKGVLGIVIARVIFDSEAHVAAAGVVTVLGHCFSIPRILKGGKGVATSLGVLLMLFPFAAVVAVIGFTVVFALTRIVSLSSIATAIFVPSVLYIVGAPNEYFISITAIAVVIIMRHNDNISRILCGREKKFSFR